MKTTLKIGLAAVLAGCAMATRAEDGVAWSDQNHTVFLGVGAGPTSFKPGGDTRQVEGIDFKFNTKEQSGKLGIKYYGGVWVSEHVGLELAGYTFASVTAPFSFSDPHDNTTGTGESDVAITAGSLSLMGGFDITPNFLVFARAGALSWKEDLKSRFDIPGQPAMHRSISMNGTDAILGAGFQYRFRSAWSLMGQYEMAALGQDNVSMATLGVCLDFGGIRN